MKSQFGVWIDHRQAILVKLQEGAPAVIHVTSDAETQLRRSSEHPTGSFERTHIPADDKREHKKTADLGKYYDEVNTHLRDAGELFIFGPGEAKTEFRKRVDPKHLAPSHISVETADSMTEPQVVAKVRQHFAVK